MGPPRARIRARRYPLHRIHTQGNPLCMVDTRPKI